MKYLNTYRLFERWNYKHSDLNEMFNNVKDILIDLDDIGFKTNVSFFYNPWITITISKKYEFEYSEVSDVVERLQEYLKLFGLEVKWNNINGKPVIIKNRITNPMNFSLVETFYSLELNFEADE